MFASASENTDRPRRPILSLAKAAQQEQKLAVSQVLDVPDPEERSSPELRNVIALPLDGLDHSAPHFKGRLAAEDEPLVKSVKEKGVLQPVLVVSVGAGFKLAAGLRRVLAAKACGLSSIPAIVVSADMGPFASLIENLHRGDFHPVREAMEIRELKRNAGLSDEKIGEVIGRKRTTIVQTLSICNLPDDILAEAIKKELSRGCLIEVAQCDNEAKQRELWDLVRSGAGRDELRAAKGIKRDVELRSVRRAAVRIADVIKGREERLLLPEERLELEAVRALLDDARAAVSQRLNAPG